VWQTRRIDRQRILLQRLRFTYDCALYKWLYYLLLVSAIAYTALAVLRVAKIELIAIYRLHEAQAPIVRFVMNLLYSLLYSK